jgi:hypothetical protein
MWLSSPKLSYAPGPVVPGSDTVWCGMVKLSFPKSAPPPPPLANAPCIRFGHTVPVANHVDVEITQDDDPTISHVRKNGLLIKKPFVHSNDHFTKAGSGQT